VDGLCETDGSAEGTLEFVGAGDGASDVSPLGPTDGTRVGALDGKMLGAAVGASEGVAQGACEGLCEGESEGANRVGRSVQKDVVSW
jgi:hypothetical protein